VDAKEYRRVRGVYCIMCLSRVVSGICGEGTDEMCEGGCLGNVSLTSDIAVPRTKMRWVWKNGQSAKQQGSTRREKGEQ
jgi:hypothetical protein